jgi:ribosome biogenesis GTPase
LKRGIIIKSTGSRYKVLREDGNIIECTIKGKFRVKEVRTTNPIAVGDKVLFEMNPGESSGVITELLDRTNYIIRKSSNLSRRSQIIAANIDEVFLVVTIKMPETPVEFIDRFLVTAEAYRIKTSIVFNKIDLYDENDLEKMEGLIFMYNKIGYNCHRISLTENINTDLLIEAM